MRIISAILIVGLLSGCSSDDGPVAPQIPGSLTGEYTGTVSYWQYKDTDSAVTASAEIEFSFDSDTTYWYNLSLPTTCGYGGSAYKYNDGSLELKSTTYYVMICSFNPLEFLVGEFRVTGDEASFVLYQRVPHLDMERRVELNRAFQ